MDRKGGRFWGITALAIAFSLASMVSIAQAGIITALTVDVGAITFDIWKGAGPNQLGAGIDVTGKTAVFAQNSPTAGVYNFDSSDGVCASPCVPAIHVTIKGIVTPFTFFDTKTQSGAAGNVLHANQLDPGGNVFDEASAWVFAGELLEGNGFALDVWIGYADSAHTSACTDNGTGFPPGADTGPAGNCHPDPWTSADFFLGLAQTGGCTGAHGDPCFDSGAIRISERRVATPEPSSMVLLGAGLIALAAWSRRRLTSRE